MKMVLLSIQKNSIFVYISFILTFSSCNNKTIEKQYVEFTPQIKHLVSSYIKEVGETDLKGQDIYIYFDVEYKILSISNDFSSPCFTDTTFDYYAKYNNYNIIISGKNNFFFKPLNFFKQIEICQNSDSLPLLTTGFEQWDFMFDANNNLIGIYVPPFRKNKLKRDSVFSFFLK